MYPSVCQIVCSQQTFSLTSARLAVSWRLSVSRSCTSLAIDSELSFPLSLFISYGEHHNIVLQFFQPTVYTPWNLHTARPARISNDVIHHNRGGARGVAGWATFGVTQCSFENVPGTAVGRMMVIDLPRGGWISGCVFVYNTRPLKPETVISELVKWCINLRLVLLFT